MSRLLLARVKILIEDLGAATVKVCTTVGNLSLWGVPILQPILTGLVVVVVLRLLG